MKTRQDRVEIAATLLGKACGGPGRAAVRLGAEVDWRNQPEGVLFWSDVLVELRRRVAFVDAVTAMGLPRSMSP